MRCVVLSSSQGSAEKGGKQIELSLRPSRVNKGLYPDDLIEGMTLSAAVASVEDHGCVLALGVAVRRRRRRALSARARALSSSPSARRDWSVSTLFASRAVAQGISGFAPHKQAGGLFSSVAGAAAKPAGEGARERPPLAVGQIVLVAVHSMNKAARAVTLAAPSRIAEALTPEWHPLSLLALKPGLLVKATVERVVGGGVIVSFMRGFKGVVDHNHVGGVVADGAWKKLGRFRASDAAARDARARVLMVDAATKTVRLSFAPHLLALRPVTTAGDEDAHGGHFEAPAVGADGDARAARVWHRDRGRAPSCASTRRSACCSRCPSPSARATTTRTSARSAARRPTPPTARATTTRRRRRSPRCRSSARSSHARACSTGARASSATRSPAVPGGRARVRCRVVARGASLEGVAGRVGRAGDARGDRAARRGRAARGRAPGVGAQARAGGRRGHARRERARLHRAPAPRRHGEARRVQGAAREARRSSKSARASRAARSSSTRSATASCSPRSRRSCATRSRRCASYADASARAAASRGRRAVHAESVVTGFVTRVDAAMGVIVTFYANVHGLVPAKALAKLHRGGRRATRRCGRGS